MAKSEGGFKVNIKRTVLVTVSAALVLGAIGYFASSRRVGVAVGCAVAGAAVGFLVDAKLQKMKSKGIKLKM